MANQDKPLKVLADAFKELAVIVNSPSPDVSVKQFSDACSHLSSLFVVLGNAFKFGTLDYVDKVKDLADASSSISTLQVMVDEDVKAGRAKQPTSHTRNLLRVKRSLEMLRALVEEIIATEADSPIKDAAFKAYNQVFAPYHGYAIKEATATGMDSLPTRALVLCMINETEETAKIQMQSYVTASTPVIEYLNKLFLSRKLGTNW